MLNNQINLRKRLLAIMLLIAFIFCALFGRLAYVQLFWGKELQARALEQWTRDLPLVAPRGRITDINGVVLADTSTRYTLYIRPNAVTDFRAVAAAVAAELDVNEEEFYTKINRRGVSEITAARSLSKEKMLALKAYNLSGTYFSQDVCRFYPYGSLLSQVLGFTNSDTVGQSGLELDLNGYLQGVNGYALTEADLIGREIAGSNVSYVPAISGMDVTLTVDYFIQALAEKAVNDAVTAYNAKNALCLVMDCNSGAVCALAVAPSFDLNAVPRDNVAQLFSMSKCIPLTNVNEPGSTFKILTSAIALDSGAFSGDYNFFCPGYRLVDGQRIRCWRTTGHGSQTFGEGICNSCNCLFMDIGVRVGTGTMYDYFRAFSLNSRTGIDFGGEASGLLIAEDKVKTVDIARMGFGQAIAVTPIELLSATCAVINGGTKVTPYLVDSVQDTNGLVAYQHVAQTGQRIIKESTSSAMVEYLRAVVDNGGGKNAAVPGYSIGGKTGTAQKYENGAIARGKYISSFIGFNADNPQYAVLLQVDEPSGYLYYGSIVAAPYVGDVLEGIFAYKGIAPDRIIDKETTVMPLLLGLSQTEAVKALRLAGLQYELEGEGGVCYQFPAPETELDKNNVVFIKLE